MRALAFPYGIQPRLSATRWMPPERSSDHDTASGVVGLTLLITAISASVRSLSQPSFLSTPSVNSGYPSLISESFEKDPSASRLTFTVEPSAFFSSRSTPKRARKQPPPSIAERLVLYSNGVPGCLIAGEPQHGQGRP